MRNRKDWVRQSMVDEAADAMVAAGTHSLIDVAAYQIGKTLGCAANSELHAKSAGNANAGEGRLSWFTV